MPQYNVTDSAIKKAYIALGSNVTLSKKTRSEVIRGAIRALASDHIKVFAQSRLFETPAFPEGSGPDFINAAVGIETTLSSQDLLATLHTIEADFGRQRQVRWEARSLDLDLLAIDDEVLPDAETFNRWATLALAAQMLEAPQTLVLPHPRLQDRGFVLVPLHDIAPDWQHPILGKTVAEMLEDLPEQEKASIQAVSE